MFSKYILPLLAVGGLAFAIFTVVRAQQTPEPLKPFQEPPTQPSFPSIAGAGIIEAMLENIPVGTNEPGVVQEVFIEEGQSVKAGDPLFRLDERPARAQVTIKQAQLAAAEAQLERLRSAPRAEDLPPAEAAVAQEQARVQDLETRYGRAVRLRTQGSFTESEYDRERYAYEAGRASLRKAEADLAKIQSGSWTEDIKVAEAAVLEARAQLEAAQVTLDRQTVHALVDGQVLQRNVRPGQFAALAWNEPLIVLGDLSRLHVRVDIDEQDVPRFQENLRAVATLKGRPEKEFPLTFVRVMPYVIPKRSLTGDNAERVDTRVLQVVYALPAEYEANFYVGQQMDVYLEAEPADAPGRPESWGSTPPPQVAE